MQQDIANRLMRVQEAAGFLSVSVSTLYGWAWRRKIPFVKIGRALRFDKGDLENFVRANRFEARKDLATRGQPCVEYAARLAKGRKEAAIGSL